MKINTVVKYMTQYNNISITDFEVLVNGNVLLGYFKNQIKRFIDDQYNLFIFIAENGLIMYGYGYNSGEKWEYKLRKNGNPNAICYYSNGQKKMEKWINDKSKWGTGIPYTIYYNKDGTIEKMEYLDEQGNEIK